MNDEAKRLRENLARKVPLEPWGPYLSERQWGTVREDYGPWGDAWGYFPFEHSHARAYRWGEDGIAGISDFYQNLCFAVAFWNGKDKILKERLFGLGNYDGNHGEDVKELYFHLDNLPTHYHMEYLYKYPQQEFPYDKLRSENKKRTRADVEYEILDTGVFDENEYFDILITYAKKTSTDIFVRIEVTNRNSKTAELTLLPTLWFYNRWQYDESVEMPSIKKLDDQSVVASHYRLNNYFLYFEKADDLLFTDNETNTELVQGESNQDIFTKDAFHHAIIDGKDMDKLRDRKTGTKCSPVHKVSLQGGASRQIHLRLTNTATHDPFGEDLKGIFENRKKEADDFYNDLLSSPLNSEHRNIQRQALAGLLWSKQYYHFDVERWLSTSDGITPVNDGKKYGRNHDWKHLKNQDIIAMPDKWEFPWYAAWDLAFQSIPMSLVDPSFAKNQLLLIMREWYMKPDGQLPAYEWNFSDVNPPVQAWAAHQIYLLEQRRTGKGDIPFLKRIFQKLLINFTWWMNRKDPNGNNMFEGGFLGLDNIGVFNRSIQLSHSTTLEQADGTSWMGMYALNMLDISLEIAMEDDSFEDAATKYFEQFVYIAEAINQHGMWNEEDKFYYDMLSFPGSDQPIQLKVQSLVGLTSLFAVSIISKRAVDKLEDFNKRINWFEKYRLQNNLFWPYEEHSERDETLLSLVPKDRLVGLLGRILNEEEFLSDHGIRALSLYHKNNPFVFHLNGQEYTIGYEPGDSTSDLFGGNSNWRGPVWIPMNYLLIRSIRRYGRFYGNTLKVECPVGSGKMMNLQEVADELTRRLSSLFEKNDKNEKPVFGEYQDFYRKPENAHLLLFHEYFHGDSGKGLGASHQTGWTALIADLIERLNETSGTIQVREMTE
jgi:hypothetical protein